MDEEYRIAYVEDADKSAQWVIRQGLRSYSKQQAGDPHYQPLCFCLYAPDQAIVGGLVGAVYWEWFQIELLWVQDELRGRGFGHRLLGFAEHEARQRGARHAYLDTFSFQAPDFYQRHGYQVFGELEDFPTGHRRYFFRKQL